MAQTRITVQILTEKSSSSGSLSPEPAAVLGELGKIPQTIRYESTVGTFDIRDIFLDCRMVLKPTHGEKIDATFIRFRNNSYVYVNMKYSDYLRQLNSLHKEATRENASDMGQIISLLKKIESKL